MPTATDFRVRTQRPTAWPLTWGAWSTWPTLERRSLLPEQIRQQAHRLRTPLSVIDLITDTMRLGRGKNPACADRLDHIHQAVGRLSAALVHLLRLVGVGTDGGRALARHRDQQRFSPRQAPRARRLAADDTGRQARRPRPWRQLDVVARV